MSKSSKPLVFLAHNSQDKPQIRRIAENLNRKGIATWLDEEQIPPGVLFQDRLQETLNQVDCAIVFIGKKGVGRWQSMEIRVLLTKIIESRKTLIPVLLPGVQQIPDDLPFLKELNYVQFTDNLEDQRMINKLIWGITGQSSHISYDELRSFLSAGLWRNANLETRRIILQSANKEKDAYLNEQQMREFDSDVLLKLDELWRNYSNNRFGFSVQKRILQDCQQDPSIFGLQVGWKTSEGWLDEAHIDYRINAPKGHLPYGMLQLVELNNAIVEGIVNTQWTITKALVTQDWQRQLISDFVGVFEVATGNKNFDSGDFKKGLDYQLKHDEPWWQGERAAHKRIEYLCLLLFSCSELGSKEVNKQHNNQSSVSQAPSTMDSTSSSKEPTTNAKNITINISGGNFQDFVMGNKDTEVNGDRIDTQINNHGETTNPNDIAAELDDLLKILEQNEPDLIATSHKDKEALKEKALRAIEQKPMLKKKLLAALKAGSIKAIEELCKHPVANILLAAFKAAFPDAK
jgi:hypothetical protein